MPPKKKTEHSTPPSKTSTTKKTKRTATVVAGDPQQSPKERLLSAELAQLLAPESEGFRALVEWMGTPDGAPFHAAISAVLDRHISPEELTAAALNCLSDIFARNSEAANRLAEWLGSEAGAHVTERLPTQEAWRSNLYLKLYPYLRSDKAELVGAKSKSEELWPWLAKLIPSPVPEATRPVLMNDGDTLNLSAVIHERLNIVLARDADGAVAGFSARCAVVDRNTRTVELYSVYRQDKGCVSLDLRDYREWLTQSGNLTRASVEARLAGHPRPE